MLKRIRRRMMIEMRRAGEWWARTQMWRQPELWAALQAYSAQTKSTGCNMMDYWVLYRTVRQQKPLEVLECGTGVSTLVIAHALMENEQETGKKGRIASMEEYTEWLEMSRRLLPDKYRPYVDFCLSETCEESFSLFRGVRYADAPERPYDFVFVDGPKTVSPKDGYPTCDFDFVHLLRKSESPIAGLVDKRVSTCFVLQQLLGDKFRYDPVFHLGIISPVTRMDIGTLAAEISSVNFEDSFRAFGRTILRFSSCP